jgi:ribonuclease HII
VPARLVAGLDEVGRGCLAGPVVAGAVIFPAMPVAEFPEWVRGIRDSKELAPEIRAQLASHIQSWAVGWAVAEASVAEIEELNILHASLLAMKRALRLAAARLGQMPAHALVDGNRVPRELGCPATAVVKGDARSLSIAAASILAKVHRDGLMHEAAARYPGYGFEVHKAYPTPTHLEALARLGVTEIHRRAYAPVRALLAGGTATAAPAQDAESFSEESGA